VLALALVVLILFSIIIAGILLLDLEKSKSEGVRLYTYPVAFAEKTYIITVKTNWTSAPEVYLPELASNYVSVDFRGSLRAIVFFNITVPADLIWGEISLIWKYYKQSNDSYTLFYNVTHYTVEMKFYHAALVEHFEIRGTEGVMSEVPYSSSESTLTPGMDDRVLPFKNGSESNLCLVSSSLSYELSEVDRTIPIKGRTLNIGDFMVVIAGEVINKHDRDYHFAISGDLFTSEGEKLEGMDCLMNEPVGEFTVLHLSSFEHGFFELFFKYDGQDIKSYDLFLALELQDSPLA
jgi:hypothetical protein